AFPAPRPRRRAASRASGSSTPAVRRGTARPAARRRRGRRSARRRAARRARAWDHLARRGEFARRPGVHPWDPFRTGGTDMTDERQIRDLIERWAAAVHKGDMATVLADHDPGIVMFDVPPPEQGVRGIDAYRETWPGFFAWQASGAVFEIESLEVTAGAG